MEITNTEQLVAYLDRKHTAFSPDSLQRLNGGVGNFVWRMISKSGESVIIKHAEPYVAASASRMPFPVDRMDFEHRMLSYLTEKPLVQETPVFTPQCYEYDAENHALWLEYAGRRTFKEAYTDPALDIPQLGRELGKWLAIFHREASSLDIGNNKTAKAIYRYSYSNVATSLSKYGLDPAIGEQVDREYGSLLATDDGCICHGDFWPGNILVGSGQKLSVVDWEMVRRGCGATDVGQFAAEAWLLDRFRGGRGLLPAFLNSYRETAKHKEGLSSYETGRPMTEFFRRVAIQLGTHLAFWPTRVSWGTEDETQDVVKQGFEVLVRALAGDVLWFQDSLLQELL
ncbi:hypothetical protein JMJ35_007862 [Cladonia borealis]|uniref:Aminoglycoside phosphotransferase domain-containing protein n=1 Tax=Cladonia borealis TaxID=184061 RepID=A0AA39QXC8_9LECA|nr:hypothetical protein JMJ35_007862 [Cladonia borealis]